MNPKSLCNCSDFQPVLDVHTCSLKIRWLDSREAAQFLKVSVPMLRNMTSNGEIPYYKLGRRNRYRQDEIEELLLQNKRR